MDSAFKFISLPEVDSTNNYLKNYITQNKPVLLIAGNQTAGRGQHANIWHSEPNKNLLLSLLIEELVPIEKAFYLSKITALAIQSVLKEKIEKNVFVKWTNDIYVENKKIAGILIENTMKGDKITRSIIGVGLNLNQTEFPSHLPNPVSLKQITKADYDIERFGIEFYERFQEIFLKFQQGFFKVLDNDYNRVLYKRGEWVQIENKGKIKTVKVKMVDEAGNFLVETKDSKIISFRYGEIRFL